MKNDDKLPDNNPKRESAPTNGGKWVYVMIAISIVTGLSFDYNYHKMQYFECCNKYYLKSISEGKSYESDKCNYSCWISFYEFNSLIKCSIEYNETISIGFFFNAKFKTRLACEKIGGIYIKNSTYDEGYCTLNNNNHSEVIDCYYDAFEQTIHEGDPCAELKLSVWTHLGKFIPSIRLREVIGVMVILMIIAYICFNVFVSEHQGAIY